MVKNKSGWTHNVVSYVCYVNGLKTYFHLKCVWIQHSVLKSLKLEIVDSNINKYAYSNVANCYQNNLLWDHFHTISRPPPGGDYRPNVWPGEQSAFIPPPAGLLLWRIFSAPADLVTVCVCELKSPRPLVHWCQLYHHIRLSSEVKEPA